MNGPLPFMRGGEIRCPRCNRKRPMQDLRGTYDPSSDSFAVKGFECSRCRLQVGVTGAAVVTFGSWVPTLNGIPKVSRDGLCPLCKGALIPIPDPHNAQLSDHALEFRMARCPGSSLIFRVVA